MIRYLSDPHFGHANIIRLADRPFVSVNAMDSALLQAFLMAAQDANDTIVCAGDLCFNSNKLPAPSLPNAHRHVFVYGNHDPDSPAHRARYGQWFGTLFGSARTWRTHGYLMQDTLHGRSVTVLVSHEPQPYLGPAWDYNVYGHHHNNLVAHPENYGPASRFGDYTWLRGSPRHFNASVEITGYAALTLAELQATAIWR